MQGETPKWGWIDVELGAISTHRTAFHIHHPPWPRRAVKRRQDVIRAIVNHWTGGENDAEGVMHTLERKKPPLSVHFVIQASGLIVQLYPLAMHCMHAGAANRWTVGIELVSRADTMATHGPVRDEVRGERIHGRPLRYRAFTAAQVASAQMLNAELCKVLELPLSVPLDAQGELVASTLTRTQLASYRGVLGHFHLTTNKRDPGLALLRAIAPPVVG